MLFLYFSVFIACSKGEEEIYVLPANYTGVIYVVFNQKIGVQQKYKDGKRVYEIPENGILKTQFNNNEGWRKIPEFYYVDGKKLTSISYQIENTNIKLNTLQICCIQNGKAYKENGEFIEFQRFFIGNEQKIDSTYELEQKRDISKFIE